MHLQEMLVIAVRRSRTRTAVRNLMMTEDIPIPMFRLRRYGRMTGLIHGKEDPIASLWTYIDQLKGIGKIKIVTIM